MIAGIFNGVLIVGLRLVPFIITLGTMGIFRGIAKGISGEKDIYPPDTWLNSIMDPTLTSNDPSRSWMLLPPGIWLLIVASVLAALSAAIHSARAAHLCRSARAKTPPGSAACRSNGRRSSCIRWPAFSAGLAGIMQYSFISGIGQPTTAIAYELFVIAAVVIGGGSLLGGEGSILGSLIGALIITILYMGGQQMGWPKWVQETVIGGIIIAAVALDRIRHRAMT